MTTRKKSRAFSISWKNGLLWYFCCWVFTATAQVPTEPLAVLSPNAANFRLFGEVPVSLYNGTANIGVPLYTVVEGPLSVPISLNYHASGFRPDQHPGWVGQGWNLSAGGVINRTINDLPDEYDDPTTGGYALKKGFYFTHGNLDRANWEISSGIRAVCSDTYQGLPEYLSDTEPDEFSFSFMGYSGKFYMDHLGAWQVQSDKPLKISLLDTNNPFAAVPIPRPYGVATNGAYPKSYGGFSILTEDGTQFIFGGTSTSIEYSLPFYEQVGAPWIANSWELTKIVAPDGHQITFGYERDNGVYINQMYVAFDQGISVGNTVDKIWYELGLGTFHCSSWSTDLTGAPEFYYHGKLISPVYLKSIQTTHTTVDFSRDNTTELACSEAVYYVAYNNYYNDPNKQGNFLPYLEDPGQGLTYTYPPNRAAILAKMQWKQLNEIKITQQGRLQKSFTLGYSTSKDERLALQTVTEKGSDGYANPPYRFDYNDYQFTDQGYTYKIQPVYLASRTDHWGFFNDTYADFKDRTTYYSKREANPAPAVYNSGMLNRITYPTGGVTDFTYEPHRYGKQLDLSRQAPASTSAAQAAGGVRIKSVSSYSLNDAANKLVKEYFYVSGYSATATPAALAALPSTGVLGGQIAYNIAYTLKSFTNELNTISFNLFTSQSALPSSQNGKGSHIGYSQVIEKRSDQSYTRFYFSNFDTEAGHPDDQGVILQVNRTPYEPFSSREQERGNLTQQEECTPSDKCVKRRQLEYVSMPQKDAANAYVRAVKARLTAICSTSQESLEEGTAYKFYTYAYLPSKETETRFDPNGENALTTTTTYSYDPSKLLASKSITDSKGQKYITTYTYPFNIPYPAGVGLPTDLEASGIYTMTARNMLSYPIETVTTHNGQITAAQVQTYQAAGVQNSCILPYKTYNLETSQPLVQYLASAYSATAAGPFLVAGGNNPLMRLKATWEYDAQSNPQSLVRDGNALSSFMWGYNNRFLIAKVENASPSKFFYSGFEDDKSTDAAVPNGLGTWYSPSNSLTFETTPSRPASPRKVAHTGQLAGAIYTTYQGQQADAFGATLTVLAGPAVKRYVLSGWVYTNGPQASIWLYANVPSAKRADGTISYYDGYNNAARPDLMPVAISSNLPGQWVYLEKEIDVPADATLLTVRLSNFWNGAGNAAALANGGGAWFDDVRLHPAGAQMTTYTYTPHIGVTSISDANNRPAFYEYDRLQRLLRVLDQERNILKQYDYHYQR